MSENRNALKVAGDRITHSIQLSASLLERIGITPEAYTRVALNALISTPKLAQCEPKSLDAAVLQCIELGLLPDRRQAVIVPFKGKAQLIPMIEGRCTLARRATAGLHLRARVVYKEDEFDYREGLSPVLHHTPSFSAPKTDADVIAAYAVAEIPGAGTPEFEVLSRADLDRYQARSLAGNRGPWASDYAEMCKKTALGLVLKRLPRRASDPTVPADIDPLDLEADADGAAEQPRYTDGEVVTGEVEDHGAKTEPVDTLAGAQSKPTEPVEQAPEEAEQAAATVSGADEDPPTPEDENLPGIDAGTDSPF